MDLGGLTHGNIGGGHQLRKYGKSCRLESGTTQIWVSGGANRPGVCRQGMEQFYCTTQRRSLVRAILLQLVYAVIGPLEKFWSNQTPNLILGPQPSVLWNIPVEAGCVLASPLRPSHRRRLVRIDEHAIVVKQQALSVKLHNPTRLVLSSALAEQQEDAAGNHENEG